MEGVASCLHRLVVKSKMYILFYFFKFGISLSLFTDIISNFYDTILTHNDDNVEIEIGHSKADMKKVHGSSQKVC